MDRRQVLKASALGLLSFKLAGCDTLLTPREAREKGASYTSFTTDQVPLFDRLGEVLVPGAAAAGFSNYIDQQISVPPGEMLSLLKYMDWPPPYADFYTAGMTALNDVCLARHGMPFTDIDEADAIALIREISGTVPDGWTGPPAPLFYFVARSDAVDVVYGTIEGFNKLNVPYLAHIEPTTSW